jgi:hypothetical protein
MRSILELTIDGQVVLEFDRNTRLPGRQRDFLNKMDEDMDQGIQLAETRISNPDTLQRARYVAMHLVQAFENENEGMMAATCAYLAQRLPGLKQVRVESGGEESTLQLVLDQH